MQGRRGWADAEGVSLALSPGTSSCSWGLSSLLVPHAAAMPAGSSACLWPVPAGLQEAGSGMVSALCPVPGHAERLRVIHPVKERGGRTVLPGGLQRNGMLPPTSLHPLHCKEHNRPPSEMVQQ